MKFSRESGQALLVVLLTMTVILTVVLSVVSRSVTDITITTYQEEAQRAFDAAEAGIEEALIGGYLSGNVGDATYDVDITFPTPGEDEFVYPSDLFSGQSATFWFVSQDSGHMTCDAGKPCVRGKKVEICWGNQNTPNNQPTTPAVELTIYYDNNPPAAVELGDFSNVKIARYTYDPFDPGRTSSNRFDAASSGCNKIKGRDLEFSTGELDISSSVPCYNTTGCLLMTKVKMFYNPGLAHPVGLYVGTGGTELPSQGTQIESTGVSGESTRRVNVFQSFPEPPFVFDTTIFSVTDLVK